MFKTLATAALSFIPGGSLAVKGIFLLGTIATLTIGYNLWYARAYNKGWADHEAAIAMQDAKAVAATKRALDAVRDCRARGLRWEQSTGKCLGG